MEQTSTLTKMQERTDNVAELRVGIVGCGRVSRRRAQVIDDAAQETLLVVADTGGQEAVSLAEQMDWDVAADWREVFDNPEQNVIVVSVPNKYVLRVGWPRCRTANMSSARNHGDETAARRRR